MPSKSKTLLDRVRRLGQSDEMIAFSLRLKGFRARRDAGLAVPPTSPARV
jgi:hypothetical protein